MVICILLIYDSIRSAIGAMQFNATELHKKYCFKCCFKAASTQLQCFQKVAQRSAALHSLRLEATCIYSAAPNEPIQTIITNALHEF